MLRTSDGEPKTATSSAKRRELIGRESEKEGKEIKGVEGEAASRRREGRELMYME